MTERLRRPILLHSPYFLVLSSAILMAGAFPNPLIIRGFWPLAWIALVPAFVALAITTSRQAAGTGALYGTIFTLLSQSWLATYRPAALAIAVALAAMSFALLFLILGASLKTFPRMGSLVAAAIWVGFEYIRTRGFLGYSFGLIGYSQYSFLPLLHIASVFGVFGPGFLVVLANASLSRFPGIAPRTRKRDSQAEQSGTARIPEAQAPKAEFLIFVFLCLLGLLSNFIPKSPENGQTLHVSLVQPNFREKQRGSADYALALDRLERLTDRVRDTDTELVVWHETAIVPSLNWHMAIRDDPQVFEVAEEAENYIAALGKALLFGNTLAEIRQGADGRPFRIDRNAAILAGSGDRQSYTKTMLVPFAESFPIGSRFPRLQAKVNSIFGEGWAQGFGPELLYLESVSGKGDRALGIPFGSPICFEDGFGEYCAAFAKKGARFLAFLTSDAWARSQSCQVQHLAASVFRAVETGLPVLRAASTGQTAAINRNGRILAELPPFTERVLDVQVYLSERPSSTLYLKLGDKPALFAGISGIVALLAAWAWKDRAANSKLKRKAGMR